MRCARRRRLRSLFTNSGSIFPRPGSCGAHDIGHARTADVADQYPVGAIAGFEMVSTSVSAAHAACAAADCGCKAPCSKRAHLMRVLPISMSSGIIELAARKLTSPETNFLSSSVHLDQQRCRRTSTPRAEPRVVCAPLITLTGASASVSSVRHSSTKGCETAFGEHMQHRDQLIGERCDQQHFASACARAEFRARSAMSAACCSAS